MGIKAILAMLAAAGLVAAAMPAEAQQTQSRLFEVTKNKKLRVCQYPLYYSISFRNPTTGKIEGIDADLAQELAKELGAELEIVESGFATFIADLQANKCEIGMASGRLLSGPQEPGEPDASTDQRDENSNCPIALPGWEAAVRHGPIRQQSRRERVARWS